MVPIRHIACTGDVTAANGYMIVDVNTYNDV
eukprot:CAMPEP_0117428724 /NCGR_PEP_ID=MMETSP0758-20121206/8359_1 /TAXON_ID=63605 /ORGANISM="Percolomonas cosmopolitus, Strain AE-1 (ATCC 50343)" /LENGTH=30 /DNA_ID= /DNA_START= /DNA_END= /DNA_ORIENTATION=